MKKIKLSKLIKQSTPQSHPQTKIDNLKINDVVSVDLSKYRPFARVAKFLGAHYVSIEKAVNQLGNNFKIMKMWLLDDGYYGKGDYRKLVHIEMNNEYAGKRHNDYYYVPLECLRKK